MELSACWDLVRPHKDFDVFPVGKELDAHFVHVVDKRWVGAVDVLLQTVVVCFDVVCLDVDPGDVGSSRKLVTNEMSCWFLNSPNFSTVGRER